MSQTDSYRTKYNLIVESCKSEPDVAQLQTYIENIEDWSSLLNISCAHGVLPLVYKTLKKQKNFPRETLNMFQVQNMQIAQRNMQMTAELIKIAKIFDENDIKYLAIKGPVLSQMIHGNTIERQYTDLDILVEKEDMYKIGKLLYKNGYTSKHDLKFLKNKTLLKIAKDFTFKQKDSHIFIEMHWKLFLDREIKKNKINLFSLNLLKCGINNKIIKTLDFEYLLIYLCLHGSKHLWERIEWVVDIDRLIMNNENINWNKIRKLVKDMQVESMFYLGLLMTSTLFKTDISIENKTEIYKNEYMDDLCTEIINMYYMDKRLKDTTAIFKKEKTIYLLNGMYKLKDTRYMAIKYYFTTLFQIKDTDIYKSNISFNIFSIYYIIRVYRFLLEFIIKK